MRKHIDPPTIINWTQPDRKNFKDISNQRFGLLTVVKFYGRSNTSGNLVYFWECRCDCGETCIIRKNSLTSGNTTSCGCFELECTSRRSTKHGLSRSNEYHSWQRMWLRCTNPRDAKWANYGGRGVTVCDRWKDFANFYADMGQKPSAKHSIDRIDNDGNYEPSNCRWATNSQQARNRRSNRHVTFRGETKLLIEWSEIVGIHFDVLWDRLRSGWSPERALTEAVHH